MPNEVVSKECMTYVLALKKALEHLETAQEEGDIWEIKRWIQQVGTARKNLQLCMSGQLPFFSTLTGTARLDIDDDRFPGGEFQMTVRCEFSADRRSVRVRNLSSLKFGPFDTAWGSNTTTVSQIGGGSGSFEPESGRLSVPVVLRVDHSIDMPFFGEDSTLSLRMTTDAVSSPDDILTGAGTPLDRASGRITLAGAGEFVGGVLDGIDMLLAIEGVFAPIP